jgi:hypothetical protein
MFILFQLLTIVNLNSDACDTPESTPRNLMVGRPGCVVWSGGDTLTITYWIFTKIGKVEFGDRHTTNRNSACRGLVMYRLSCVNSGS